MNKIFRISIGAGLLGISAIGINEVTGMAIANPLKYQFQIIAQQFKQAIYGLGLPKTAGTGGSVRLKDESGKTLPILALMVPEDGARTVSSRPTVYWNMILKEPQDYKLTFFLQETAEENSKVVLEQEITITNGGLFKFQIPQSLDPNTPRRWGVKCKWPKGRVVTGNGFLAFSEPKPELKTAIDSSKTDLDKARVYASNGYWYDALDAYTNWIEANPNDAVALHERGKLINAGFTGRKGLDPKTFIAQINSAVVQEFK